jgi:hypothetical protein
MQIQNSQSMIQHLESGGNLALNKQGQLETQSASGRFFQKIGDAFRSLTSSGRAAIETRNAHLNTAMANMLRDTPLVNLAQGEISAPMTQARRNALVMSFTVARAVRDFPPEARAAARNLGLSMLRLQGLPERGEPAETRGKALAVMNKIRGDEVVFNALHCDYARDHDQLERQLDEMSTGFRYEFTRQKDSQIKENGMHKNYLLDAERGAVRTIDGRKPDAANYESEFMALIPPKFRGFLSMMASQAGLLGAVNKQFMDAGRTRDDPRLPPLADMVDKGITPMFPSNHLDIEVVDNKARLKVETDVMVTSQLKTMYEALGIHSSEAELDALYASPFVPDEALGGGRYRFEMVVDLGQDMTNKEIPDFELVNASRAPIAITPSISAQPPAG